MQVSGSQRKFLLDFSNNVVTRGFGSISLAAESSPPAPQLQCSQGETDANNQLPVMKHQPDQSG